MNLAFICYGVFVVMIILFVMGATKSKPKKDDEDNPSVEG